MRSGLLVAGDSGQGLGSRADMMSRSGVGSIASGGAREANGTVCLG